MSTWVKFLPKLVVFSLEFAEAVMAWAPSKALQFSCETGLQNKRGQYFVKTVLISEFLPSNVVSYSILFVLYS